MAEDNLLPDDLLRQLMSVGEVDLLVGICSHSNVNSTSYASNGIERVFQQHFVRQRAVIVNVSSGGTDEDAAAAENPGKSAENRLAGVASLRTVQRVRAEFPASSSPATALRTILTAADLLRARACAVISPETANLSPDWIAKLLAPVYREQFDFVAPLYRRHKFQGLLARNLLYPMSRAVFGCKIRELYVDEWGFSGRFAALCGGKDVWHEESIQTRPEAWMAISAISSDFRCCQTFLGQKVQSTTSSGTDLVEVFRQTVGNLFWCMESQQSSWVDSERSGAVHTVGPENELTSEPSDLNRHRIFEMFRNGVTELEPILISILDPETHAEIKGVVALEEDKFRFRPDLWVRTLYDFAAAYHHGVMNRDHLVQALAPLYRGMTFSFLTEHSDSSPAQMEAESESLCLEFERQKAYLREKWSANVEVKS